MTANLPNWMNRPRCDLTPAWRQLDTCYQQSGRGFDLRQAFAEDARRFELFSQTAPHVFADLSKNRIDAATQQILLQLARECRVEAHRDAMFAGEAINTTEGRAVLHTLLRAPRGAQGGALAAERAEVHATLDAMLAFAETLRADPAITDVVNIGIGGSDLGPQMAVLALDAFASAGKRLHFVSNVDGHELAACLKRLQPRSTRVPDRLQDLHHDRDHDQRAARRSAGSRRMKAPQQTSRGISLA